MWHQLVVLTLGTLVMKELVAHDCQDQDIPSRSATMFGSEEFNGDHLKTIQLFQKSHYVGSHLFTCRVDVHQRMQHCGMHSHISAVGLEAFVHQIQLPEGYTHTHGKGVWEDEFHMPNLSNSNEFKKFTKIRSRRSMGFLQPNGKHFFFQFMVLFIHCGALEVILLGLQQFILHLKKLSRITQNEINTYGPVYALFKFHKTSKRIPEEDPEEEDANSIIINIQEEGTPEAKMYPPLPSAPSVCNDPRCPENGRSVH